MEIFRNEILMNKGMAMNIFKRVPYQAAPSFLGEFSQHKYIRFGRMPTLLERLAYRLMEVRPNQIFNTAFVQRYAVGEFVAPHRDPKSNIDHTLIGIFGDFEGAVSAVAGETFQLRHGDVLSLPCTIDGVQGPIHSVSPVTQGVRYALILNTIERTSR